METVTTPVPAVEQPQPGLTTPPPTASAESYPAVTANRLQDIILRLLKLRNMFGTTIPVEQQYALIDGILPDILQSMREITTGPSVREQMQIAVGLELAQMRHNADLALAKLRGEETPASRKQFLSTLLGATPFNAAVETDRLAAEVRSPDSPQKGTTP